MQVQQSEDKAHFITRLASKYSKCLVVDLIEENYYLSDFGKSRTDFDDDFEFHSYSEWLQIFIETQIDLTQQSRIRDFLSISNLQHSLNEVRNRISLTFRDRTLPAEEAWKKLQVILLTSDEAGIPKRVVITQETVNSVLCSNENRFFNSKLFGVIQFGVNLSNTRNPYDFSYFNVNEKAAEIMGYGIDEFYEGVKSQRVDFIASADIVVLYDVLSDFQKVGDRTPFHLHVVHKNGDVIFIGGEAELCVNSEGVRFVQMLFIDETNLESQLSATEDLKNSIKSLTETVPCGFHRGLIGGKNSIESVSRNFTLITGYDLVDLQERFGGVIQRILATPEDVNAFNSALSKALISGERVKVDMRVKHNDGSIIMVRDWLYVVHGKSDKLWLYGAMLEYTDEKKAESRANMYQTLLDFHKKSDEVIQKIGEYVCPKIDDETISLQSFTKNLSDLTSCSVILFEMNDEKKITESVCSHILPNDLVGEPISLRYEALQDHVNRIGDISCRVVPNPIILQSFMKPEFFAKTISPELKQFVIMPVDYKNNRLHRFFIFRNPDKWLMHDSIPRAVYQMVRLAYQRVINAK